MGTDAPPLARVERARGPGWVRLLPVVALVLGVFLLREAWGERGPRIRIQASDGHGLAPGDRLRYRGIEVGRVESLELAPDRDAVFVEVRLARSASTLARAGARFWVERPVLGVEGVRGLETALGGRHLAVLPGAPDAPPQVEFIALEEPPLFESEDPAALEVRLLADERGGLARGAPVLYRGIPIGSIVSVGLAGDATAVELRARVLPQYAELVRLDSRFYRTRGAALSLGLGGLELSIDSLQSLWLGGVALATPTRPGARAPGGQRFELAPEAEEAWLAWRPALAVGGALPRLEARLPERVWGQLRWEPRGWFARARTRGAWLVSTPRGWLGPADVLAAPEDAAEGSATLEVGGESLALAAPPEWSAGGLARRTTGVRPGLPGEPPRPLEGAEDLLLCADPARAPMAVAREHLEPDGAGWRLAPVLPLDESWHGALVVARADGRWVGLLLVEDGAGRVVPLPSE